MKGDIKAIHNGLEGIYIINRFNLLNGKPFWEHKNNVNTKIWFGENGTMWNIGTYYGTSDYYVTAIYSIENAVGPLETNSWAYYNGSDFIFSTDISLEGNLMIQKISKGFEE